MIRYLLKRILYMIPVLIAVSILSFVIIQLPPGDFLTSKIAQLEMLGEKASESEIASLRAQYGLERPLYERYFLWITGMLKGDLGKSFIYNRPVSTLIGERLALTMMISTCSIILSWAIAIPVGIFSAIRQYSFLDYVFTFVGFIGISIPTFFLALLLMFGAYQFFDLTVVGLFSPEYAIAPWSFGKFLDLMKHIWLPAFIVGVAGTAGTIRVMRGCLLDELGKQYVIAARARGVSEWKLLLKYPVRIAINPMLSTIGWILPVMVSGSVIVSVVLNLPTTGPLLLEALEMQDMYLAGSFIMILSGLTVIGTVISDLILAWSDPRIRYE